MAIKVSVIVPVYNAASTLRKCVDSLLAQTLKDFEVLLVDDGSTDESSAICDEYAGKDSRVKAFHKANGGVSSARQFGIDHAQGEYTIHADPDDWVEPEMLEELYKKAKEIDADMVICDYFENTYKGQKLISQKPTSIHHKIVLQELFGKLMGSMCNKLIRRTCYEKFHVQFPMELSFCEDQYVCAALAKEDIKIGYVPKAFYHYERPLNKQTLSRRYNEKTLQEDAENIRLFYCLLKDTDICSMVDQLKRYQMLSKAFYWGDNYFSSNSFKSQFSRWTIVLKGLSIPKIEKFLIILSCKGYYRPCKWCLGIALSMKHFFTRFNRH